MLLDFYKYQGTGNDFIVVDNRKSLFPEDDAALVARLCDRRFGIGSDGIVLIEEHGILDFTMTFYNPDGSSSFCGNGSRCAVLFAKNIGLVGETCTFEAIDGQHEASISGGLIKIRMRAVDALESQQDHFFVHTGSPHYIQFVDDVDELDLLKDARAIRYSEQFKEHGTNVNYVEVGGRGLKMRTYERGVEDETLSCGTGVTAVALAGAVAGSYESGGRIETRGGELRVHFKQTGVSFADIWLEGPAAEVFKGTINV